MLNKSHKFLVNNNILNANEIFDYSILDNDLIETYELFDRKFQSLFTKYSKKYNIDNPHFFINNARYCNAGAKIKENINIITITSGYPVLFINKFNILKYLKENEKINYLYQELINIKGFDFYEYMLDCSIYYTFHHEFRHIQQMNDINFSEKKFFNENNDKGKFCIKRHAYEFDADRNSVYGIIDFIIKTALKLKINNSETFKGLIYLSMASIIITKNLFYFKIIDDIDLKKKISKIKFYTSKNNHPHPLVRLIDMIDTFYDNVRDRFNFIDIEMQDILNFSFEIANEYFNTLLPGSDIIKIFINDLKKYLNEINEYNKKIYDYAINENVIKHLIEKYKYEL